MKEFERQARHGTSVLQRGRMSASGGGNDGFTAENNVGLAFGLNILAGACTGIGAVAVVLKKDISPPVTGGILSLSAGVMVFVSFVDIYMSK